MHPSTNLYQNLTHHPCHIIPYGQEKRRDWGEAAELPYLQIHLLKVPSICRQLATSHWNSFFHFTSFHFTSLHFTLLLPYNFAYIYLYIYTHIYRYLLWVPWVPRLEKKPVNATTLHLKAYASSEADRVGLLLRSKFILFTTCICYLCLSYIYIPILIFFFKKKIDISSQKITSLESSSTNNVPPSADCGIILLVMLRMWLLLGI